MIFLRFNLGKRRLKKSERIKKNDKKTHTHTHFGVILNWR